MKKQLFTCLMTACIGTVFAQQGGIDAAMLTKIQASYTPSPETKVIKNALHSLGINKLAVNSDNAAAFDSYFSNQVNTKSVTNQKSSGRCWLFTGLNVLRNKAIAEHHLPSDFQFSQNYLFFWDQLEKANLFLQAIIETRSSEMSDRKVEWFFKNPIGDGGQFTGVANLVAKYGVVPRDVMPETYSSNNTSRLSQLLRLKLREFGLQLRTASKEKGMTPAKLNDRKIEMLGVIYRMLALNLGEPVKEFTWSQKDAQGKPSDSKAYTPQSFCQEFANQDFNDYIMIMNDPTREYNKVYEIEYDRHVYEGQNWKYLNLPMDKIAAMAIASIKDSTAMYFSCDVSKFLDRDKGFLDINNYDYASPMGVSFEMNKKERIATFASGSSHAMTLIAVDLDDSGQPKKWMVENSWGSSSGYKGNLIMTNEWFNEYMFRLVVERKYVPADILNLLNQKPTVLPPWDPMFAPEK
jgi:bleomycin hydrolase